MQTIDWVKTCWNKDSFLYECIDFLGRRAP